jgi:hypothetical protein
MQKVMPKKSNTKLTINSPGVLLSSTSFIKHASTNASASLENLPSGPNLGAGSLTIWCMSSIMLIVIPPPWRETPFERRRALRIEADVGT